MIPQKPIKYPEGSVVKTEEGTFYIKGQLRYSIPTERVINSWSFTNICAGSEESLSKYPIAGKIGFRDGSLVRSMQGDFYIISASKKRKIVNPDWFNIMQLNEKDFIRASDFEINLNKEGEKLE